MSFNEICGLVGVESFDEPQVIPTAYNVDTDFEELANAHHPDLEHYSSLLELSAKSYDGIASVLEALDDEPSAAELSFAVTVANAQLAPMGMAIVAEEASVEAMTDRLASIGRAIQAFIKKIIAALKKYLDVNKARAFIMRRKLAVLQERAEELPTIDASKMRIPFLKTPYLYDSSRKKLIKTNSLAQIASSMGIIYGKSVPDTVESILEVGINLVKGTIARKEAEAEVQSRLATLAGGMGMKTIGVTGSEADSYQWTSVDMPGALLHITYEANAADSTITSDFSIAVHLNAEMNKMAKRMKTIPVLDRNEILNVIETIGVMLESALNVDYVEVNKNMQKLSDVIEKELDENITKQQRRDFIELSRVHTVLLNKFASKSVDYNMKTAGAWAAYCKKSYDELSKV